MISRPATTYDSDLSATVDWRALRYDFDFASTQGSPTLSAFGLSLAGERVVCAAKCRSACCASFVKLWLDPVLSHMHDTRFRYNCARALPRRSSSGPRATSLHHYMPGPGGDAKRQLLGLLKHTSLKVCVIKIHLRWRQ